MRRASCKFSTSSSKQLASLGEQTSLPGTSIWLTRFQLIVKRGKPRPAHDRRPLLASSSGQRYTVPITGMHAFRSLGQNEIGCRTAANTSFCSSTISVGMPLRVFHHWSGSKFGTAQIEPSRASVRTARPCLVRRGPMCFPPTTAQKITTAKANKHSPTTLPRA
jgi:hypothetical protein